MRIVFLFLFLFSFTDKAVASSKKVSDVIKRFEKILPDPIAKVWNKNRNGVYVAAISKDATEGCSSLKFQNQKKHKSVKGPKYKLFVNTECLADIPEREFSRSDFVQIPVLKSLYKSAIKLWYHKDKLGKKLRSIVYAQSYYQTPFTLGVDVRVSLDQAMINFWTETTLAYMTDSNMIHKHPDVYAILRQRFFDEVKFFPENLGNLNVTKPSSEIYPSLARIKFIESPSEAWFWRYSLIKNAKTSIEVQSYLLGDDIFSKSFIALLIEAMQERGVKVKVMLDGRGSLGTARANPMEALAYHGAEVVTYNPMLLNLANIPKYFKGGPVGGFISSNHDKIILVDDVYFITGGRNIEDKYFLELDESSNNDYVFRDLDIYAEFDRPFISAQSAFYTEFYSNHSVKLKKGWFGDPKKITEDLFKNLHALEERMKNKKLSEKTVASFPQLEKFSKIAKYDEFRSDDLIGPLRIQGLDKTSALLDRDYLTEKLYSLIRGCERLIVIQNPYILLTDKMEKALIEASQKCKIIMNTTSPVSANHLVVESHMVGGWKKLLRKIPNAELHGVTSKENLHTKLFVFDTRKVLFGGYNMDSLSENYNSEFALLIDDPFVGQIAQESINQYIISDSLKYDVEKNIGPMSVEGAEEHAVKLIWLRWISKIFGLKYIL